MKKVLILTGSDSQMHDVLNLTVPSKERYAKKHNYDFIVKKSFDEELIKYGGINIGFIRTILCFNYLEQYDIVAWIDADSIITNDLISIEEITNDKHCFYASYDWLCSPNSRFNRYTFSTGNFIIRKNSNTIKLFNSFIYHAFNFFKNDIMADQGTLNYIHQNTDLKDLFLILEHKYLGAVPACVKKVYNWKNHPERFGENATYPIEYEWNPNCFLAHLTGCLNDGRIELLLNDFKEYL